MERAALITGGSSGIGLAIARALGEDGYRLTISARRPDKLEAAADELRERGRRRRGRARQHGERGGDPRPRGARTRTALGRLDVLVNNAGIGIGGAVADAETKKLDLQLDVNLRAVYLLARESIPLLKEAGAEHGKALMANTASIAGKHGQGWLAAYSATKFGVVGLSQALHKELSNDGIQVTAICPAFVATPMTDWVEGQVPKDEMIQPEDIAEAIRFLLRTSRHCVVPEMQFLRPADSEL